MITALYTFEGVRDPSENSRGLKRMLSGLTFTETTHGVEVLASNGEKILVPWSNIGFLMLENEKPVPKYTEPPVLPVPAVVATPVPAVVTPPKLPFEVKRGPGRPRKDG